MSLLCSCFRFSNLLFTYQQNFRLIQGKSIYRQQHIKFDYLEFLFECVKNIPVMGKGEYTGHQYLFLVPLLVLTTGVRHRICKNLGKFCQELTFYQMTEYKLCLNRKHSQTTL